MGSVIHQTGKEPIDEIISIENEETSHFFEYKMIGRSVDKRQINVVYIGERVNPKLKIFIMAGQHGDEIYCRKATERYDRYSAKLVKVFCALKIHCYLE